MTIQTTMLSQLRNRREGFSLPRGFYTEPAFHQVDMEAIYYRDWIFAGHDCEINAAGAFFTLKIGEYPITVVRGNDGAIRAFHNSCRHRGSRICTTEHGRMRRLTCPYHQWVYNLDGSLFSARHMGEDFDKSAFGLKRLHCESFAGYIFVCLADVAPDFAAFRASAEPYLAPHKLKDVKVAHESTIVEKGNWKLVWENNRECYHCATNHPELCRTFPEAPAATGVSGGADDPEIAGHWARCEAAGLPSTFAISEDGQYRTARMPLLRDAESFTMSGKAAVARKLCDTVVEPRIGTMLMFHYPSIWNHILGDAAVTFRVLPLSATETELTTKWMVHKDAVEGVDYTVDELINVWIATNTQALRIIEEKPRGILSR